MLRVGRPPELVAGEKKACFAVTEPDSGLNTSSLKTRAEPDGKGGYVVHGQKLWTSTAQVVDKMLLIARTTPQELMPARLRRPDALLHGF